MDYTTLGRTGLKVSVMGLGCGGHSRLGLATGGTEESAVGIVQSALARGINFIDTAEAYGTETVVGKGIAGTPRDQVVLSTKVGPRRRDGFSTAAEIKQRAEDCLRRLNTDYVDVLHFHGISAGDYPRVVSELLPAFQSLRDEGKARFLGITEAFGSDTRHAMLAPAVQNDDHWDVVMVGFSLLNQSARQSVFPATIKKNIGTLDMFAVRRALSQPAALKETMEGLAAQGLIDRDAFDADDPLGFLVADGVAESIPDAAYRFCRYEPGMHVVLSGTGNPEHLEANAASLTRPPLPPPVVERLRTLFARVDTISGN